MVEEVIRELIVPAFAWCAAWVDQLFDAVDGYGVLLAAFLTVLVIGLLFIPMRGNAMTNIEAYRKKSIYSKQKAKAKAAAKSAGKKGG